MFRNDEGDSQPEAKKKSNESDAGKNICMDHVGIESPVRNRGPFDEPCKISSIFSAGFFAGE